MDNGKQKWDTVVGLEVHVQLATRSKIFSGASAAYGAGPNTQACAVDLALPGVLPVLNREAVCMAVKFGLAIGAQINRESVFARKNYFYPDLPKGYQISQYEKPIVSGGTLAISAGGDGGAQKNIGITRAHLEEDAGKSLHEDFHGMSGIDLNRAGTPLLEIVSEPDLRSAAEAAAYLKKLHTLVRYLEICDGNMQEGSFRFDANVSLRPRGEEKLGVRTEIKNVNSFRFIEKAVQFEVRRQMKILDGGGAVVQETRSYDSAADETRPMRGKEEADDYRYFPDPDLPPLLLEEDFIAAVRAAMPELPEQKAARFIRDYALTEDDAETLTAGRDTADYFEAVAAACGDAKSAANWINGELAGHLNRENLALGESKVSAQALGELLCRVSEKIISGKTAKEVLQRLWNGEGASADEIIAKHGLKQITDDDAIEKIIRQTVDAHPEQARQFRDGNEKVLGYLVGQVMKSTKGKAEPRKVNAMLRKILST